jgi:hypothetical protein
MAVIGFAGPSQKLAAAGAPAHLKENTIYADNRKGQDP